MLQDYTCIGILSDTHGYLPESVLQIFKGNYSEEDIILRHYVAKNRDLDSLVPVCCEHIAHAGDIGDFYSIGAQAIIDSLEEIAPVTAVLGNCDNPIYHTSVKDVEDYEMFIVSGVSFAMFHDPHDLSVAVKGNGSLYPAFIKPKPMVGIHGHTHLQKIKDKGSMLKVCPGSTTRSKKDQRCSVMVMYLAKGEVLAIDIVAV